MNAFIPVDIGYSKLSVRMRNLRRDWFTMQMLRLFVRRLLDKENEADLNRLDKILMEVAGDNENNKTNADA